MVWHGDGLLWDTARLATAVLGGLTFSITTGNKGNKGNYKNMKYCILGYEKYFL